MVMQIKLFVVVVVAVVVGCACFLGDFGGF